MTASVSFRTATMDDLPALIDLLADDKLGQTREMTGSDFAAQYSEAMGAILADPHNDVILACIDGNIAGMAQLTFIPGLTYTGGVRAQIEGVRVKTGRRGAGVGSALLNHAIDLARQRGCVLIQLTTDKRRPEAVGFYEKAGFKSSHEGMKKWL